MVIYLLLKKFAQFVKLKVILKQKKVLQLVETIIIQ